MGFAAGLPSEAPPSQDEPADGLHVDATPSSDPVPPEDTHEDDRSGEHSSSGTAAVAALEDGEPNQPKDEPPQNDLASADPHPEQSSNGHSETTTQAAYDAVEQALGANLFADEDFDDQGSGGGMGYIPMQVRPDAPQYQPGISVRFGRLPNKVDLRPLMSPVQDQGELASGVAHAVAGAYDLLIKRVTRQSREVSPLFLYYNARWREGRAEYDGGCSIQSCLEALAKLGACSERLWPFDPNLVVQRPGADAYQDAAPPRVQDMAQVPLRLPVWKQALAEGKPVIFGLAIFEAIETCADTGGVVPMPAPDDVPNAAHALHAMCAVGYSDTEKVFIVRNSRGPDWGDNGYCYIPYAYVLNPRLNDGDCWVFVSKSATQPPREAWSDDLKRVAAGGEGVSFPIETHTIEEYANVAVDLFEPVRQPYQESVAEDYARYVSLAGKGAWSEMESFERSETPAQES